MKPNIVTRMIDKWLMRDVTLSAMIERILEADSTGTNFSYNAVVKRGYMRNPYVMTAMRIIIDACKTIKFELTEGDGDKVDKPNDGQQVILNTLMQPNADQTYKAFLEEWLLSLHLFGAAYIHAQQVTNATPPEWELRVLKPDTVEPKLDSRGIISHYEVRSGSGTVNIPKDNIIESKFMNPFDRNKPYAPVKAAGVVIETFNNGLIWNSTLLKNMGLVSAIAIIKGVRAGKGESKKKLEDDFKENFTGPDKIGKVKVMFGDGVEYQQMGHTTKDLDWLGGKKDLKRDIASVMNVPVVLMNSVEASTFSNVKEARKFLYQTNILSLIETFFEVLTFGFARLLDENTTITKNISNVPELRESENDRVSRQVQKSGWWTINELRKEDGLDPQPGGDVLLTTINQVPLDFVSAPLDGSDRSFRAVMRSIFDSWADNQRGNGKLAGHLQTMIRNEQPLPHVDIRSLYPTEELRVLKLMKDDRIKIQNERKWIPELRKYFKQQRDLILEQFKSFASFLPRSEGSTETRNLIPTDWVRDVLADGGQTELFVEDFLNLQLGVITQMGESTINELVAAGAISDTVGFDIAAPEIQDFIANDLATRSNLINQTTADQIQTVINRAVNDGAGSIEIQKLIKQKFDQISTGRTLAIARTEVGRAANMSIDESFRQAGVPESEWITARDNDVRDGHQSLDGVVEKLGDLFVMTGGLDIGLGAERPMEFGEPRQDINCRCTKAPIFDRSDVIPAHQFNANMKDMLTRELKLVA